MFVGSTVCLCWVNCGVRWVSCAVCCKCVFGQLWCVLGLVNVMCVGSVVLFVGSAVVCV